MTKKDLIQKAYGVDSDSEMSLFISSFQDVVDVEVVATLCAWASNGVQGEESTMERFIESLGESPASFVLDYDAHRTFRRRGIETFYGMLTYRHLDLLLMSLSSILTQWGSVQRCYQAIAHERHDALPHEVFAYTFGSGTGFPTRSSKCTFYRYALLLYWLTYKLRVWDVDTSRAFIPCNDHVIDAASELGIIRRRLKTPLNYAVVLSDTARDWFGDKDFYKMYELLAFYE